MEFQKFCVFIFFSFFVSFWFADEKNEFPSETAAILCVTVFAISILMPKFAYGKNAGIKVSLLWSTNLMAAILGVLGLYCHLQGSFGPDKTEPFRHIPLICLALFYFFHATGPLRLSNEYAENVIPKKCYFTMRCMLTMTSWLLVYVITRMLPQLIDHIGVGWLFWFMAVMCVLMSLFVKLFVDDLNKVAEESRLVDNSSDSNSEAWASNRWCADDYKSNARDEKRQENKTKQNNAKP